MQTTQELLKSLRSRITDYNAEEEGNMTKEELKSYYNMAKEISATLSLTEIRLLWYLRNTQNGDTFRFMKAAQKLYEANTEFKSLSESSHRK